LQPLRKNFAPFAVKVFSLINNRKAREGNTTQRAAKRMVSGFFTPSAKNFALFAVKRIGLNNRKAREGKQHKEPRRE
jgi:hypothetical protein